MRKAGLVSLRRRSLLIVLVGAVLLAGGVVAVGQTSAQTAQASVYESSAFGFRVDLPAGWRRSDRLSGLMPQSAVLEGQEVFTMRSVADEAKAIEDTEFLMPAFAYTVVVEVYRNPARSSSSQFVAAGIAGKRQGQRAAAATVDGTPGVRVDGGSRYKVSYYVARGPRIYQISYVTANEDAWRPPGADEAALQSILGSLRWVN